MRDFDWSNAFSQLISTNQIADLEKQKQKSTRETWKLGKIVKMTEIQENIEKMDDSEEDDEMS